MKVKKIAFTVTFAFVLASLFGVVTANSKVKNFRSAKRILEKHIYRSSDDRIDYYCGCKYSETKVVNPSSCGFKPKSKSTRRSTHIEWEHIVPAYFMGKDLSCWSNGGRKNCENVSKEFNKREADLHNLIPVIGELNQRRSNYLYSEIKGERRDFGKCNFEVYGHKTEIPDIIKGDIARRFLYISYKYNLNIPDSEIDLMWEWHENDPVDNKERILDRRIKIYQGDSNPLLKDIYK